MRTRVFLLTETRNTKVTKTSTSLQTVRIVASLNRPERKQSSILFKPAERVYLANHSAV